MIFGKNRACFAFANVKTPCDQLLKMGRSCKIISEEGFFFRILVPMKRKGDARPRALVVVFGATQPTHRTRIKHTRTLIVRKFIVIELSPTTTTTTTTTTTPSDGGKTITKITLGPNF